MAVLATNRGVISVDSADQWQISRLGLDDKTVTAVTARKSVILAGTLDGVYRTDNAGQDWIEINQGLTHRHIRWLAFHPQLPERAFAGTEPAGIFVLQPDGHSWRECKEVTELRDHFHWSLPYSPEAGCVRGFAAHGERVYAAVEVGGVLRSDDGGLSWRLAEGSDGRPNFGRPDGSLIHPDVHSIDTHPSSPELVYAPTGGGVYRSTDGGKTWQLRYACYVRAAWIDPQDADHIVLGPADGVDRNGRIEESWDGGATWKAFSEGLATPWPRHMVERFTVIKDELIAVLSNGDVLARPLHGGTVWQEQHELVGVNAAAEYSRERR